jgi:hypothetical protein
MSVSSLDGIESSLSTKPVSKGFASLEAKRHFLENPTRFPTDAEWNELTPIERNCFLASMED